MIKPIEQAQVVSIKSRRTLQSDVCSAATSLAKKPQKRSRITDNSYLSLNLWKKNKTYLKKIPFQYALVGLFLVVERVVETLGDPENLKI